MEWLFYPRVHHIVTLVHLTCAMFWLGWMVFFSIIMTPVLRRRVPDDYAKLRAILQYRTRKLVRPMIVILVLTGLHNMLYRGLFQIKVLFYTTTGLWFILKISLAVLLIGLYFLAPDFSQMGDTQMETMDKARAQRIATYVHGIILTLGLVIAYLGVSLSG